MTDLEYLHQCLVRWVIALRLKDRASAHRFLEGGFDAKTQKWVDGWNKKHPESTLERDVKSQWTKGNRGGKGEWK